MTRPHAAKVQATRWPPRGPAMVIVAADRPLLIEHIRTALNHSVYTTRAVSTVADVANVVTEWQPHLAIVDMDLGDEQIRAALRVKPRRGMRLPVIGLTQRGDLQTRLAAFEAGVDDILTVPFASEELLARVNAVVRRATREAVTFTLVIRLGELEIDILNRTRAGWELGAAPDLIGAEPAVSPGCERWPRGQPRRDPQYVMGCGHVAESNVVDCQIRNLRARLHDDWRHPRFIATVPGQGYRFLPLFDETRADTRAA